MLTIAKLFLLLCSILKLVYSQEIISYSTPEHPLNIDLFELLKECSDDIAHCTDNLSRISSLSARIANEHASLLLYDRAQDIFEDILYFVQTDNQIGARTSHTLSVLSFAQGRSIQAEKYWSNFSPTDLASQRSIAAQALITGAGRSSGINYMYKYLKLLRTRFESIVEPLVAIRNEQYNTTKIYWEASSNVNNAELLTVEEQSRIEDETREELLALLLSEAQGSIRLTNIRLTDLALAAATATHNTRNEHGFAGYTGLLPIDAKLRFQLGMGLAKLGLFELSMKHIFLAAAESPWEAPLYSLRAMLVLAPVHTSVRSLAAAIDQFEMHAETILLDDSLPLSTKMQATCRSPEEAALILQSLPLLHLAGFSAPLHHVVIRSSSALPSSQASASAALGYSSSSSISLPALLSEVYSHICPPMPVPASLQIAAQAAANNNNNNKKRPSSGSDSTVIGSIKPSSSSLSSTTTSTTSTTLKIGVLSGSFDTSPGRIMIGLLESMSISDRKSVEFIAMCFPTPRDSTTDRVNALFDSHINLTPGNLSQAATRIVQSRVDFLLFADAALDSRVFALAHERLAIMQGMLWNYGGTMGIPTIDYYFIPEILWSHSHCPPPPPIMKQQQQQHSKQQQQQQLQRQQYHMRSVPPQALFAEQVVLLEGLPYVPQTSLPSSPTTTASSFSNSGGNSISNEEVRALLQTRYLLPATNQTHLYVFPGSVKHLHPEFDRAIDVILKTDPLAVIVLVVSKTARENVPPTHIAVRHDLMHPLMPAAAVSKCLRRLRGRVGVQNFERVRVLPPVDEAVLRALQRISVAVLDPFPVGMHLPVLQAMLDQVPVLSSFILQECSNSHAYNIGRYLNISATTTTTAQHLAHQRLLRQKQPQQKASQYSSSSIYSNKITGGIGAAAAVTSYNTDEFIRSDKEGGSGRRSIHQDDGGGGYDSEDSSVMNIDSGDDEEEEEEDAYDDDSRLQQQPQSDNTQSMYPSSPEEYGVLAVRLQREPALRAHFIVGGGDGITTNSAAVEEGMNTFYGSSSSSSSSSSNSNSARKSLDDLIRQSRTGSNTHGYQLLRFIRSIAQK